MEYLSIYAAKSCESMGRDREEAQCDIRTVYQRDRDRIIHCKAFRRLKHKTQVFLAPMGDHYRTRLTHTLEVSQIARTISEKLPMCGLILFYNDLPLVPEKPVFCVSVF